MNWLGHWLGLDNGSGPIYLFWSGPFSALPSLGVFGVAVGAIRRLNCDVHGCWRWGHLPAVLDGVHHHMCRKHHPTGAPTAASINEARDA